METKIIKVMKTVVTGAMEESEVKALEALGYRLFCEITDGYRPHCVQQKQEKAKDPALETIGVVPAENAGEVAAHELIIDS